MGEFGEPFHIMSNFPGYAYGTRLTEQQLQYATGKPQAEGTFDVLETWNIKVGATTLIFDTTASNGGWKGGATKILEGPIGRKLCLLCMSSPCL